MAAAKGISSAHAAIAIATTAMQSARAICVDACSRFEQRLPMPANSRKANSTTATAYSGWLRNSTNFWMNAISMNMKPKPIARK